jgi:hypothetical protein
MILAKKIIMGLERERKFAGPRVSASTHRTIAAQERLPRYPSKRNLESQVAQLPSRPRHAVVVGLNEMCVPEPLCGSVLDPRISYPPVIIKSDVPKQLFIHSIANSYRKLMLLLARIKELMREPGVL